MLPTFEGEFPLNVTRSQSLRPGWITLTLLTLQKRCQKHYKDTLIIEPPERKLVSGQIYKEFKATVRDYIMQFEKNSHCKGTDKPKMIL